MRSLSPSRYNYGARTGDIAKTLFLRAVVCIKAQQRETPEYEIRDFYNFTIKLNFYNLDNGRRRRDAHTTELHGCAPSPVSVRRPSMLRKPSSSALVPGKNVRNKIPRFVGGVRDGFFYRLHAHIVNSGPCLRLVRAHISKTSKVSDRFLRRLRAATVSVQTLSKTCYPAAEA